MASTPPWAADRFSEVPCSRTEPSFTFTAYGIQGQVCFVISEASANAQGRLSLVPRTPARLTPPPPAVKTEGHSRVFNTVCFFPTPHFS
jgi:hypothetical protein